MIINETTLNGINAANAVSSAKINGANSNTEEKADSAAISKGRDVVDLSEQAEEYLTSKNTDAALVVETEGGSQPKPSAVAVQSSSEDSEDDDVEYLYNYTENQLRKLLSEGSITQLEYNNEIARRTSEE